MKAIFVERNEIAKSKNHEFKKGYLLLGAIIAV